MGQVGSSIIQNIMKSVSLFYIDVKILLPYGNVYEVEITFYDIMLETIYGRILFDCVYEDSQA